MWQLDFEDLAEFIKIYKRLEEVMEELFNYKGGDLMVKLIKQKLNF